MDGLKRHNMKIEKGFSVSFGPDPALDYYLSSGDIGTIEALAKEVGADFIEIRFWGDPEHRGKNIVLPDKNGMSVSNIEDIIRDLKGKRLNLHLSEQILPYLDSPDLLGYNFLKRFDNVIAHREEMELFIRSLEDRALTEAVYGADGMLAPIGEPAVIDEKWREKFLIENTWDEIRSGAHKAGTVFFTTAYLAANKYNIGNVLDMCHLIRGFNHHRQKRLDRPKNYIRYVSDKPELVYEIQKACQNTREVHVHGIEWSEAENRYKDHQPLRKASICSSLPQHQKDALYTILKNAKIESYTVELRKQYHTVENIASTAANFEALLKTIRK